MQTPGGGSPSAVRCEHAMHIHVVQLPESHMVAWIHVRRHMPATKAGRASQARSCNNNTVRNTVLASRAGNPRS